MYLTKGDANEELQGFRKNLDDDGKTILDGLDVTDANGVEDRLNDIFGTKEVNIEYTLDSDQKTIEKINMSKSQKQNGAEDGEPNKKKLKKEEK